MENTTPINLALQIDKMRKTNLNAPRQKEAEQPQPLAEGSLTFRGTGNEEPSFSNEPKIDQTIMAQAVSFGNSMISSKSTNNQTSDPGFGQREQIPLVERRESVGEKLSLNLEMQENLVTQVRKNQEFYNELEITMDDLELIEQRIKELEEYIGIDPNTQLEFFIKNDIEKLDVKCNQLEDFVTVIEDKNFMMNDLFNKYDQLESFLKNGNKFSSQCISLSQKSNFIAESQDEITEFAAKMKEI